MDWYRVEVPKNDAVSNKTVTATPIGVDFDSICLIVQDAFGKVISTKNGNSWMAQPGATYYISVTRKDGVKDLPAKIGYTLELSGLGSYISPLVYNNGYGVKSGTNKLAFDLGRLDSNANYKYIVKLGWGSGDLYTKYQREVTASQQGGIAQSVDIDINKCGSGLRTVVELYKDNALIYSTERTDFVTNNKIEFEPVGGGTFIYDNSPEYLLEDDFADYNLGDKTLYTAENVEGIIDIQSSHSVPKYVLDKGNVYFDFMLYNPTDKAVTVNVLRFGAQLPLECAEYGVNATSSAWVCLQAWADYLQMNIDKSEKGSGTAILKIYNNFEDKSNQKYESYTHKNAIEQLSNNGHYVIQPGQTVWVMGSSRLCMKKQAWSPVNMVARLSASGPVNISILAFRDINNVYSPKKPELVYREDQRNYPSNVSDTEKENDLNQKYKGTANSLAEVEAHSTWIIDDNTNYYSPYVFNMANPEGYNISQWKASKNVFWLTNYNVNEDRYNNDCGTESEILPLEFTDSSRTWHFDTRHFVPAAGNGILSGTPPVENATVMGNYGVIQRYYIDIKNDSSSTKKIVYALGTESHAIVRYKFKSEADWKAVIKCFVPDEYWDSRHELFSVTLPKGDTDTLILEVLLPNGDKGGFRNMLFVEN